MTSRISRDTRLFSPVTVLASLILCGTSLAMQAAPLAPTVKSSAKHSAAGCSIHTTIYDGWKAEEMSNAWVKLYIVPQLGGRLMQVEFGGHDYLFVNDQLKGQTLGLDTEHHRWYNYGGDKIWPMPEGNDDEQHWPGAGGSILDEDPFTLAVVSRGATCRVRLTGPVDPQIGQQYIREISIGTDSPVIRFHAVMKNVTGHTQRWSEQSVSQYNASAPDDPTQFNQKFWGMTPANPASVFPGGYHVRTGNQANPGYTVNGGMFHVQWNGIGGEVWTDSPAGWLAVVDGTTGYTMVERNTYDPRAEYPDQTTMLFFTTGIRRSRPPVAAGGAAAPSNTIPRSNAVAAPTRPRAPIYYMEAEVDSPMITLAPGESYAMDTSWYPTRMGEDFKIATDAGVVGTPLAVSASSPGATSVTLAGNFGVFYEGKLIARFYDRDGLPLGTAKVIDVSPLNPIALQSTVQAPAQTFRVALHLVDKTGSDRGLLGEAFVNPPPPESY